MSAPFFIPFRLYQSAFNVLSINLHWYVYPVVCAGGIN
jgi:hypothetical protein